MAITFLPCPPCSWRLYAGMTDTKFQFPSSMKVGPLITIIFNLLAELIQLYYYVVMLACLFSFLLGFGILDPRNQIVWNISNFLFRMTEPVLRPIRNIMPNIGNIDLSPLVLLLLLQYVLMPVMSKIYGMLMVGIA